MKKITVFAFLALLMTTAACTDNQGTDSFRDSVDDGKDRTDQDPGDGGDMADTLATNP